MQEHSDLNVDCELNALIVEAFGLGQTIEAGVQLGLNLLPALWWVIESLIGRLRSLVRTSPLYRLFATSSRVTCGCIPS